MTESYCGNDCSSCKYKYELKCKGCKEGPGRFPGGDCTIARCCRDKNIEKCSKCKNSVGCTERDSRSKRAERRLNQKRALASQAEEAGKWLTILFWMIIPSSIASILAVTKIDELVLWGLIVSAICSVSSALVLLKLRNIESLYGSAGVCSLIVAIINIVQSLAGQLTFFNILMLIVALIEIYSECKAHSSVLNEIDGYLSAEWENFWKIFKTLFCVLIGAIILAVIVPGIAILILILAAIPILILAIKKLVLLYQTAGALRNHYE